MGNMHCPAQDAAHLAVVARDVCPFPNYSPGPHFFNMLSINSSLHLKEHYAAVQSSLSPTQLEDFTRSLRTTFGREGKVSFGGVGVVALSLAVLFETVAKQVKGEYVSHQEPIPGLFLKDLRGYYPPEAYTISKYLRLVPHIANNPSRMREETERYLKELKTEDLEDAFKENTMLPKDEDITEVNMWKCNLLAKSIKLHLQRITNYTLANIKSKSKGTDSPLVLNLNCDPNAASEHFVAELDTYDSRTKEAFRSCKPDSEGQMQKTVLQNIAMMNWVDTITLPLYVSRLEYRLMLAQTEEFDLKANALGKWT